MLPKINGPLVASKRKIREKKRCKNMWVHRQAGRQASGGPELLHPLVVLVEIRLAHRLRHLNTGSRMCFGWKIKVGAFCVCDMLLYIYINRKNLRRSPNMSVLVIFYAICVTY